MFNAEVKNMKKAISSLLASVMLAGSAMSISAADDIKVILDGSELMFDVPPQIVEGRTLVPLRIIFEALGAEVDWNGETRTVTATKADTTVKMTVDDATVYVNETAVTLDVPPQIIDDRTLVPARAVAESFDADVAWNGEERIVTISSKSQEQYTIKYDYTLELQEGYMRDFKIKSVTKNADGDFDITYTLRTFFEGRGTVVVDFNCLDSNGNIVGKLSGSFLGTDYTWTPHEATATVPGTTAEIQLILK